MNFIFDIDGTICFDGIDIDDLIYNALIELENLGHQVIFASARPFRDCINVIKTRFENNYVIGLNGGTIHHFKQVVKYKAIDDHLYKKVADFCYKNDLAFFIDDLKNYHVYKKEMIAFYQYVNKKTEAKEVLKDEINKPIKMVINLEDKYDFIAKLNSMLDDNLVDTMYHEKEQYFYINAYNVNKGTIIKEFFNDRYIAFGNDKNDFEMLNNAEVSIVVGNDYLKLLKNNNIHISKDEHLFKKIAEKIIELGYKYKGL